MLYLHIERFVLCREFIIKEPEKAELTYSNFIHYVKAEYPKWKNGFPTESDHMPFVTTLQIMPETYNAQKKIPSVCTLNSVSC